MTQQRKKTNRRRGCIMRRTMTCATNTTSIDNKRCSQRQIVSNKCPDEQEDNNNKARQLKKHSQAKLVKTDQVI